MRIKRQYYPVALLLLVFVAALGLRTPDTDRELMHEKYSSEQSGYIESSGGLRLHYREQGVSQGVPILLLHGNSGSLHVFESLIDRLNDKRRIISIDLPGHGLTGPSPAEDYSYQGFAQALDLVRTKLDIDRLVLVGHSMGGWIAWRYAADHSDAVSELVLIAASGMPPRSTDPPPGIGMGIRILKTRLGGFLSQHYLPRSMTAASMRRTFYNEEFIDDASIDRFWELLRYPGNRRALSIRSNQGRDEHLAHRAKDISAPTLLIWGEQDTFVRPSAALSFSERIANSEILILPNVGHMPMLEATAQTAEAIDAFLDR